MKGCLTIASAALLAILLVARSFAAPPIIGELEILPIAESAVSEVDSSATLPVASVVEATAPPPESGPTTAMYGPPSDDERRLLYMAMHHCDNAAFRYAKPFLKLALLRLEREMGLPEELHGVTLAAWCGESAYQLDEIIGDGGNAVGILQMHATITLLCGPLELRSHPLATARCWLWNLARVQKKTVKRCGQRRSWKAAELWLSQGGAKSGYSCKQVSGHVARLERWQRKMRHKDRVAARLAARIEAR